MQVYFYNVTKKRNSTYIPTQYTMKEVILKHDVSIINPVLAVQENYDSYVNFNYFYIPKFKRYYYITNVDFSNNIAYISGTVDVLASYRVDILNSTQYIIRSQSYWNGNIMDSLYPTDSKPTYRTVDFTSPFMTSAYKEQGSYIIGKVEKGANFGALKYSVLNHASMVSLIDSLISKTDGFDEISKSIVNPLQYIKSCKYFPIPHVSLFKEFSGNDYVWKYSMNITLPKHPQSARGEYLNYSPYTELYLNISPFGTIVIDTHYVAKSNIVQCVIYVDLIGGNAKIELYNEQGICFDMKETMLACDIPLSQVTKDYMGLVSAGTGFIGSLLSGNIGGAISGISNGINSMIPKVSSATSGGSLAHLHGNKNLVGKFEMLADENIEQNGRPCMQKAVLKNLTGFCQVQNGDIAISGTQTERAEVKALLESGIYIE
jgi:hypothetical protein|nr:MAG TPA: hypothetical protein [Caudoviricetes sp.]